MKKNHSAKTDEASADAEAIKRYENMSPEAIDAELKRNGINPARAISTVTRLVQKKLAEVAARAHR